MELGVGEVVHVALGIFGVGAAEAFGEPVEVDETVLEFIGMSFDNWREYMVGAATLPLILDSTFEVGDRHSLLLQEAVDFGHDFYLILVDGRLWGEERFASFADLNFGWHTNVFWWIDSGESKSGVLIRL